MAGVTEVPVVLEMPEVPEVPGMPEVPEVPSSAAGFGREWGEAVVRRWLEGRRAATTGLAVSRVEAALNSQQVQYSVLKV
jgi:hypothetical protein